MGEENRGQTDSAYWCWAFFGRNFGESLKKWNHFDNLFIQIFSLPKKMQALFFVGTMRFKDWASLCQPVLEELLELQNGLVVFDASLQSEILAVVKIVAVLADNPRAAEISSTICSSGNFPAWCTGVISRILVRSEHCAG
jgi:hypothetical protein